MSLTGLIEAREHRATFDKELLAPKELVAMLHLHGSRDEQMRGQAQEVVVARWSAVARLELDDREKNALLFKVAVGPTVGAKHLGATDLKPDGIDRVVDHTHRIALGVARAYLAVVSRERRKLDRGIKV